MFSGRLVAEKRIVLLMGLLLVLMVISMNPVVAKSSGKAVGAISGKVTANGRPGRDCTIEAYDDGVYLKSTKANGLGRYVLLGLEKGKSYKILFQPNLVEGNFAYEWYGNAGAWSSSVAVKAPAVNINATLENGSTISGAITHADSGSPFPDCCITPYDSSLNTPLCSYTISNDYGYYTVDHLREGVPCKIWFSPKITENYSPAWYNGKVDWSSADTVIPRALDIDAHLKQGCRVSGTVTAGGIPVKDCQVGAYNYNNLLVSTDCTNARGQYSLAGLAYIETFRILYLPSENSYLAYEYYDNASTWSDARTVPTRSGNINATLENETSIFGKVIEEGTGRPVENCMVSAYDPTFEVRIGAVQRTFYTDSEGNYRISGLRRGVSCKIFFDSSSAPLPCRSEWYDNKADWNSANAVAPTNPPEYLRINAVLTPEKPKK